MRRPITTVHQIEVSSRCNLACKYCPHPKLRRVKEDMRWPVFERSLEWAASLGGPELSFTGMGEALLHPDICDMLFYARRLLPGTWFLLATNGVSLVKDNADVATDRILAVLRECEVSVYVSTHRPEVAGPALELLIANGIRVGVNTAFVTSGFDWAGQVEWHGNPAPQTVCQYLAQGWATILQNGDVVNCCMDAHGAHPVGNVTDLKMPTHFEPIPLCEKCHLKVPEEV